MDGKKIDSNAIRLALYGTTDPDYAGWEHLTKEEKENLWSIARPRLGIEAIGEVTIFGTMGDNDTDFETLHKMFYDSNNYKKIGGDTKLIMTSTVDLMKEE